MSGIEDWEPVPAQNNASPPVGAPENHDRTDVNNIAREMMASQRADWEGSATGGGEWRNLIKGETLNFVSGTVVDVVGVDVTAFFPTGRKIRVLHSSGSDAYCFVVSSAFTTNTRITVADFDSAGASAIGAAVNRLQIHNAFGGEFGILSGAFESAGGSLFEIPTALTAAGINAAITAASSAGKIVLLDDDEYVLEAAVELQTGVSIWGRGMTNSTSLKVAYDGYAITSGSDVTGVTLRDFRINGDSTTRSAGGGISLGNFNRDILLDNLSIVNVWQYGIATQSAAAGNPGLTIRNVFVNQSGNHCIFATDAARSTTRNIYEGLNLFGPGSVGEASASAAGMFMSGESAISDVVVILSSMATATGIRFEQLGVAGNPTGGRRSTLNGFKVDGNQASQVGLFVGGTSNVISNGHIKLGGVSAKPLVVDGRGGSPEQALDNQISGVRFDGGLSCTIAGDALRTELLGCTFNSQSSVGLAISGTDTLVKDCTFIGGQATGIQATGSALDVEISGCTVRDTTGDGINIQSGSNDCVVTSCTLRDIGGDGVQIDAGADRAQVIGSVFDTPAVDGVVVGSDDVVISGCTFRGVLGDGVQVDAGADRTRILSNIFDTVSGSDVSDGGTDTVFRYNVPQIDESITSGTTQGISTLEEVVTGMGGIAFPGAGANGTRRFVVHSNIQYIHSGTSTDSITSRIRRGPLGTLSDPIHISDSTNTLQDGSSSSPFKFIVTPAIDDLLTMSAESDAAENNVITGGMTFFHIRYLDS